ncbi:hypothetical protein K431DRAFT_210933, partial [Polychaeton citri CBS 116435]
RRRNSSFSSNHDRSPITPTSKHRFSNASIGSNDLPTPGEDRDGGLGNLADELGDLENEEDEIYEEEGERLGDLGEEEGDEEEAAALKEARDSGVDVSYRHAADAGAGEVEGTRRGGKHVRNFSKPFGSPDGGRGGGRRLPEGYDGDEEPLSRDLEELMVAVAKMANSSGSAPSTSAAASTATNEDPLIPRAIAQLQDLGNQTALEQGATRLNTSTNSMTSHLTSQTKSLQSLASSLYKPFGAAAYFPTNPTSASALSSVDPATLEETIPFLDALLSNLPHPDTAPLQGLQKLSRETDNVMQTLSQLTDTLQMGKQATGAAARHLRTTQMIVAELRRERERADDARLELASEGAKEWEDKVRRKWCRSECEDVVKGFEGYCDSLRVRLEEATAVAA